jgi:DNA helicase II / ATP-dependent DNA helicase PcrA
LEELGQGVIKPEDILVLAPRRRIGYRLRDYLISSGQPVKSYFRESAISKDQVKRAYSLLNLFSNPDDLISLRFLLGYGSPDFRRTQYRKLRELAQLKRLSISEILDCVLKGQMEEKGIKTLVEEYRKVLLDLANIKKVMSEDPIEGFQKLFIHNEEDEIEFYEINQLYKSAVDEIGTEDIEEDASKFNDWFQKVFTTLQESIALPDSPEDIDHIRIMSLHSSKGLSAKLVILCSMIDHLIPYLKEGLSDDEIQAQIQEQRRLFYVALTRCKSSSEYMGRLIVSSYTYLYGLDAVRMGISANPTTHLRVSSTRYLRDFGRTSPKPIVGSSIINIDDF